MAQEHRRSGLARHNVTSPATPSDLLTPPPQACGPDELSDVILAAEGGRSTVAEVLVSAVGGHGAAAGRASQKEGCWVAANIAAGAERHRDVLALAVRA